MNKNTYGDVAKVVVFAGMVYVLYNRLKASNLPCYQCTHTPKMAKSVDGKLAPIMDPLFNVREACKELVLLEQHLNTPAKQCGDCIKKHFLTIEGLFEEATAIDKYHTYGSLLKDLPAKVRNISLAYLSGDATACATAQKLRQIRKPLMAISFKHV